MTHGLAGLQTAVGRYRGRGRLLRKYGLAFVLVITGTLLVSGTINLYFSYHDQSRVIFELESEKAAGAAASIDQYVREIRDQIRWAIPPAGLSPSTADEYRLEGFYRLKRLSRAVTDIAYLDSDGREQLRVSRIEMDVKGSGADYSNQPEFLEARSRGAYYSPVSYRQESEPYMTVAMLERPGAGVTVAWVNLKLLWDIVREIRIGETGYVYVVDNHGYLLSHPDISLVLQKTDVSNLPHVKAALENVDAASNVDAVSKSFGGRPVLTAHRRVDPPGWFVFVDQPLEEAYRPVILTLARTLLLLVWGVALAILASYVLARRMVNPINALQAGAARVAAGSLGQRVDVRTGDELEELANEFNLMADRVQQAHEGLEQEVAERTQELRVTLKELEEKSRQLAVASHNRSAFLRSVAHDLRTPLNSMMGFSNVLARQMFGPLNSRQLEYLRDILTAGHHQLDLIIGLQELAKKEDGVVTLEIGTFSLVDVLQGCVSMMREATREGDLSLTFEPTSGIDLIEADEGKVREIILNLLSNAVKFTGEGGRVTVRAWARGEEAFISVSDTGIGIAPEDQERVFEEYERVEQPEGHNREGTGLGLASVRKFVQLHGGRIWLTSQVGAGSTFTLAIPVHRPELTLGDPRHPAPADRIDVVSRAVDGSTNQVSNLRVPGGTRSAAPVLVVDDDPSSTKLIDAVLRPHGYTVIAAANGAKGLELIRSEQPGLVILDLVIPGIDGYGVVERVRSDPALRHVPIVVLTGESLDARMQARLDGNISDVMPKGDFDETAFIALVHAHYQPSPE